MLHQLNAQDAQFLYVQSAENLTQLTSVAIYDPATTPTGKVRLKDIIEHVRSRINISPVFKRKLHRLPFDIDHPYWVEDPHFDLEAHISHSRLPDPGDWRQFCIHVARHHSRPMDMNRPLWDMYVVEGLDRIKGYAPGSYAILTRIHHCAIDGASGAHFFIALSDIDAKKTPTLPVPENPPEYGDMPNSAEIVSRALAVNLTSPVKFTNSLMRLTPTLLDMAQTNLKKSASEGKGDKSVPDTRFNGPVSPHKMFEAVTLPLDKLKQVKNLVEGATINDAVIAIIGGGLRKYLTRHKELPTQSMIAMAPVNLRSKDSNADSPGNNITAMSIKIHSDIANPIKRLTAVRDTTRDSKAAKSGVGARVMTDLSKHIPGATMAAVARLLTSDRFAPKMSNLFISNVPGPQFPIYMAGAKVTHQYALAPLANGMGLFMATPSYDGMISFNIISDREMMPDIVFFRTCIEKSFQEYVKQLT